MRNTPTLQTERLILRRFTGEDAPALLRILGDRETNTFLPWFPIEDLEQAGGYLRREILPFYKRGSGCCWYAVCLKEDNIPMGYVHMGGEIPYDLGYGLSSPFWRRGFAVEACRAVVEQLRREGCPYLTATHDVKNPASGGVMKKLGMAYRYSYEERWQPKDILVTFRMYQLSLDGREHPEYRGYWEEHPVHFAEQRV